MNGKSDAYGSYRVKGIRFRKISGLLYKCDWFRKTGRMGDSVYLKAWDEFDHHSVILTKSTTCWNGAFGFQSGDIR